jgi:hypothetical protein
VAAVEAVVAGASYTAAEEMIGPLQVLTRMASASFAPST